MLLHTSRLEIAPLTPQQFRLWLQDLPSLERELGCTYQAEPLIGPFAEIVKGQLAVAEEDAAHFLWYSFWLLIRKEGRVAVGSAVFKGPPDATGTVEIGYGLGKAFEKKGFMTEAVGAICAWALRQEGVLHVTAETERAGFASQAVLKRCGFEKVSEGPTIWWQL